MSLSNFWEMIAIICQIDRVPISPLLRNEDKILQVTCYHSVYIHNLPTSMHFSFLKTMWSLDKQVTENKLR